MPTPLACLITACLLLLLSATACAEQWAPFCISGGEGGQRPNSMAAGADGKWVLCGTDVGGVLHSLDGGQTWAHIGAGFDSYGSLSMTTDPRNADRAYVVGVSDATTPNSSCDGIFRSTDGGSTWKRILTDLLNADVRDRREQIAVDATSFDPALRYCTTLYYAQNLKGKPQQSRIVRSTDGGDTWTELQSIQGAFSITVCTKTGALLAGGGDGLYRSTDRGESFTKVLPDVKVTALHAAAGIIAAGTKAPAVVCLSRDGGATFEKTPGQGLKADPNAACYSLKISPANPQRMLMMQGFKNGHGRFITHDGGQTWQPTRDYDRTRSPRLICGQEASEWKADHAWHPTDENICWSTNHDYLVKSDDGGKSFFWASAGYTGIYLGQGHSFHFNPHNPDYLALSSLDWNGAATFDGGKTWTEMRFRGNWWGWTYACMAVEPGVFFGGAANGHGAEDLDLYVTYDNGKTCKHFDLNHPNWRPSYSSYIDPKDASVWFWLSYRSADRGQSWQKLDGCAAVYTHDPATGALYGIGGPNPRSATVVRSTDHGQSWQPVVDLKEGEIRDIALDHLRQIVYIALPTRVLRHDIKTGQTSDTAALPADQLGNTPHLFSIAADPVDPQILYLANGAHYYVPDTSALRSTDGGQSWRSIFPAERHGTMHLRAANRGSGIQDALWVRVHPITREALFGSNCKGFFKIGPPQQ